MNLSRTNHQGIGMTSQRTRDRLIQRLRDQGIESEVVLEVKNRRGEFALGVAGCRDIFLSTRLFHIEPMKTPHCRLAIDRRFLNPT